MLCAKLIDRLAAIGPTILCVIVDDHAAADRKFAIQIGQRIYRRLVIVAVETKQAEPIDRR